MLTRVSGIAQKPDLVNQTKALEAYCHQHSLEVDEWMSDIGSGLNYKRKQFHRLMEMVELGQVRRIILAHRDRLVLSELSAQKRIRFNEDIDTIRYLLGSCLYQCLQGGKSLEESSSLFGEGNRFSHGTTRTEIIS
ncbi:hypothetical protein KSC_108370 [Ktedonobacter sp. SOSP1-52]|nr:hypothetical protein KSC_108370 [Ktedonobacter sp. SOSP1-52]